MNSLKEIIKEVESIAIEYVETKDSNIRNSYNQYIELVILEAPKSEQYNLYNYWSRLVR